MKYKVFWYYSLDSDFKLRLKEEWTMWPYWRRTWPPTGNDLRQLSSRPKFGSKVVAYKAKPFEKIF